MAAPEPGGERWRRLHPATVVFDVGNRLGAVLLWALAALFFAARTDEAWYFLFLLPPLVEGLVRFASFRYALGARQLVVREGILVRRVRHVPLDRVQNLDTVQGPVHRALGVVEVRLETAAGSEPEAVLRVITSARLAELRAAVQRGGGAKAAADGAGASQERAFFRMGTLDVLLFGLLSQRGLVLAGGALVALRELVPEGEFKRRFEDGVELVGQEGLRGWLLVGGLVLLLLQAASALWAYLTLDGFRVEREGDDLRTTCGLLTHQSASLPRSRVQFLEVRRGPLQRLLGRVSVRVLSAGGDSTRQAQISRKWLVPSAPARELEGILAEVQPGVHLAERRWRPVHPRARRRLLARWLLGLELAALPFWWASTTAGATAATVALVLAALAARERARVLAWDLGDDAVFLRDGVLGRRVASVRFEKIQSVALRSTPFDRRVGMARVSIDTAGAPGTVGPFHLPYLGLRDAARLVRVLRAKAAALDFRW